MRLNEEGIMRGLFPLIFFIFAVSLDEISAVRFKLTNAKCVTYNKTWVTIQQCRLKAVSRYKTTLNINATFHYPAPKIDVNFKVVKRANGYKPFLSTNHTVDACAFMKKPNHPFVKMIFDYVKDYSSITHSCPYVGKQYVKDFYITGEMIPLPIPSGDYGLLITWVFSGTPIFTTDTYFAFQEDLINM